MVTPPLLDLWSSNPEPKPWALCDRACPNLLTVPQDYRTGKPLASKQELSLESLLTTATYLGHTSQAEMLKPSHPLWCKHQDMESMDRYEDSELGAALTS